MFGNIFFWKVLNPFMNEAKQGNSKVLSHFRKNFDLGISSDFGSIFEEI